MEIYDTTKKVSRIGMSLRHSMNFHMRDTMMIDVTKASDPERVVASAEEGIR